MKFSTDSKTGVEGCRKLQDKYLNSGPFVLTIDIGSSSIRIAIYDRNGIPVPGIEARRTLRVSSALDGASTVDPGLLLESVWDVLDGVLRNAGNLAYDIAGVGLCTFSTNILGIDGNGKAVTPLITYADTRAAMEVAALREKLDARQYHDRTGCCFHTGYLPAILLWLLNHRPALFARIKCWLSIAEYIERHLFGSAGISCSMASWTGLFNRHDLDWDDLTLSALPVDRDQLSPVTGLDRPKQGLRTPFAKRWPCLRDVPWFPAVADGAAANIGCNCASPDQVCITIGTSSAVRAVFRNPVSQIPEGLWCYRVDAIRPIVGGALSEGGNVFQWLTKILSLPPEDRLESALAKVAPDGHGLTVLPMLCGERSPGWAGNVLAAMQGISQTTTSVDIVRAWLESVAFRIALVFELLRPLLPDSIRLVANGGALLNSPVWLQIVTDAIGMPVVASRVPEASSRGVAALVFENLAPTDPAIQFPDLSGTLYKPDALIHERYQAAIACQKKFYDRNIH